LIQLAEIDPYENRACPRAAGSGRQALAVTALFHAAVIGALAAITLANPSPPAPDRGELQASFAATPRAASEWQAAAAIASRRPLPLPGVTEFQFQGFPPAPRELFIPASSDRSDPGAEVQDHFEREFILTEASASGDSAPPTRTQTTDTAANSRKADVRPPPRGSEAEFVAAKVRSTSRPQYPATAMSRGHEGVAQIRLSLDAAGRVTAAALSSSSGHAALDKAALKAAARWKFAPATSGGRPVASVIVVPIRFSLR
jgi:protein TonB